MRLVIVNRQRQVRVQPANLRRVARGLARLASADHRWREVTLLLVDDEGSAQANHAVLGHAGPTDVITQRYEPLPGEQAGLVGEIIVNVQRAAAAAPHRRGWNASRELALYVAHGCDHLNGEDDSTPGGRRRMRRRELRWLAHARIPRLL